jgi:hypothetical protein
VYIKTHPSSYQQIKKVLLSTAACACRCAISCVIWLCTMILSHLNHTFFLVFRKLLDSPLPIVVRRCADDVRLWAHHWTSLANRHFYEKRKQSRVDPQMVSMYFYSFLKVKAISDVYFPLHSKLIDKILIRFGLDMHVYLFFKHVGSLI